MTAVDDVVLPSFTNIGEPTSTSSEDNTFSNVTVIYSSIPPDVNMDSMSRATKSSAVGEMLRVSKRSDGKLSIFACESAQSNSPSVYDRGHCSVCVVCHRTIVDREMFLNFPDDLDRRRLWGNMLGFKYSDMLRMRDGSVMLSTGLICTDHFSEECFRVFNFNKAAIETLGMPTVASPSVRLTPSKKWIPWDCTVCSFQSHSVYVMQRHMVQHTDDVLLRYHPKSPRGLLCPFCRKCTYGYKTMSGLRRHLLTPPIQHCQLKRIFEIARSNCRSSLLDPVMKWSSWTDRNVYLAYHGCEPPPRTPRKVSESRMSTQQDTSDHSNSSSPGILHSSPSTNNAVLCSQPTSCSGVTSKNSTPDSTKSQTPRISPANSATLFITPPNNSRLHTTPPTHVSRKTPHQNPRRPLIFPSPVKRDSAGVIKPSKTLLRPVLQLRKPLLPDDTAQKADEANTETQSQNAEQANSSDEKCRTVAKIILKATSAPHHTLLDALNLMSANGDDGDSLMADPALAKPLFSCSEVAQEFTTASPPLLSEPRPNKTRRQLESVEARLRIFGDCSRVEVPSGYTTIETHSGVRLMSLPPDIKELFYLDRIPSLYTKVLVLAYLPIGRHSMVDI
ncbi:THAP-type domain-containing protein [Trichostrongylus colubriformis]|uniref:THAP-type domain-containing protein n=1 Tax=Trichostrongylus colubriformis TaxID=6319 RepID=A0AAN8FAW0_TRICO